jgi:hypothetical protein
VTVPELLQLYAPLAGMLALAFWVGVLSERVKGLQSDVQDLKDGKMVADAPAIVRLESAVTTLKGAVDKLTRGMDGVQRQLGNLMQKPGAIAELRSDG